MTETHDFNWKNVCKRCGCSRGAVEQFGLECKNKKEDENGSLSTTSKTNEQTEGRPDIAEKVRFWEEQDKIK